MKICMVVPNASVKGGIASVVNGYYNSSLEQDHEVMYVESYIDGSKFVKLKKALCSYVVFLKTLICKKPDIVHIHSSFGPSFYRKIPFIYFSTWAKIPVVNHIHGAEFDSFYENASRQKRKLVSIVYRKCSRLIVLSQEWKEKITQIVPKDRIDIVENYCVIPKAPYDIGRDGNQILFLGMFEERKGCYDIPDILEIVKQSCPQAKLIMAGDGQLEKVKEAFDKKNLLADVTFPGWVRGAQKKELLQKSAVFLFPSYHEGMPMAVLEAMSYGMGVVTTSVGGIPQLVQHEKSGYLERAGDIDGMAEDIIGLLQDTKNCYRMGLQARETAKKKYSLEVHLQKLEQTYRKACELK